MSACMRQDAGGRTPLHVTARAGQPAAAQLLLRAGASAAARARDGSTALHAAARCGGRALVLLLLAAGADAAVRDAVCACSWFPHTSLG